MKKLLNFCLFTVLALALTLSCSCSKNKKLETTIEGRVLTRGTSDFPSDTPVPVYLVGITTNNGDPFSGGEKIRDSVYTNANGRYKFDFKADFENQGFYVRIPPEKTPDQHWPMSNVGGRPARGGKDQKVDIVLSPFAWLKLHVKNINPQPGDEIRISLGGGIYETYYGAADVEKKYIRKGNVDFSFPYAVDRNGETTLYHDTVYLPAFDTTYHKIEY